MRATYEIRGTCKISETLGIYEVTLVILGIYAILVETCETFGTCEILEIICDSANHLETSFVTDVPMAEGQNVPLSGSLLEVGLCLAPTGPRWPMILAAATSPQHL